jgi:hypothetical protein
LLDELGRYVFVQKWRIWGQSWEIIEREMVWISLWTKDLLSEYEFGWKSGMWCAAGNAWGVGGWVAVGEVQVDEEESSEGTEIDQEEEDTE